jgi:hypothetical protein
MTERVGATDAEEYRAKSVEAFISPTAPPPRR